MTNFQISVTGTTPLMMNRFTDEAALKATSGHGVSTVGNRGSPKEICQSKLYTDSNGTPVIPQQNIFRCIVDAGTYFKAGKSKVTTQKSSLIPACLSIPVLEFPLKHKDEWTVDARPVRIPATGGRILCYRPMFHDWSFEFEAMLDERIITAKLFREIVDAAGQRVGIGDFRPACKGPFGKFVVTGWDD